MEQHVVGQEFRALLLSSTISSTCHEGPGIIRYAFRFIV